jgi:hypothetical protein
MPSDEDCQGSESGRPGGVPGGEVPGDESPAAPAVQYYRSTDPVTVILAQKTDETQEDALPQAGPHVEASRPTVGGPSDPSGLGGWMVLPVVLLFLTLIVSVSVLFASQLPLLRSDVWSDLTTSGTTAYHPLWAPMIVFETFVTTMMIVFPLLLLVLIFRKRRMAPRLVIGFAFFILIARVLDSAAVIPLALDSLRKAGYLDTAHDMTTTSLTALAITLVLAAIWIPYFFRSKRVKNTFVRGRALDGTPPTSAATRSRLAVAWTFGVGVTAAIVLIVLLSWGTATLSHEIGGVTTQSGGIKTYTDPDYGYSFAYPAEWVLQTSGTTVGDGAGNPPGSVSVFDPEGAFGGAYALNMATATASHSGLTFEESMLPGLKTNLEGYISDPSGPFGTSTIIKPLSETTLAGVKGFTVTLTDTLAETPVTVTLYFLLSGTLEYDLVLQTATEDWQEYQASFDTMLSAFKPGPGQ